MSQSVIAFVCVQNAGRSQMATAFAKREKRTRGMNVKIITGGTRPAEHVHPEVIEVMKEKGIDLSDQTPRGIIPQELEQCHYVITMGCGADDVCPASWTGDTRDWKLDDPDGKDLQSVRATRDEIERRVSNLFDELEEN